MSNVRIGVVFPNEAIGTDAAAAREFAQMVEELGFAHIIFYDHVLGAEHAGREPALPGPYTEADSFHEPLVLMGYLAACTSRIELATGILIVTQRQTVLVAKQVAELQILSQGRIRLGVGIGWNHVEYESLGIPWESRGARLEEQIAVLRQLWTQPVIDFNSRFHRVDRAGIRPLPTARIPLWFGGFSPAQQDRTARVGDGFFWQYPSSYAVKGIKRILDGAAELGRDPLDIGFDALFDGTADDTPRDIERWAANGGTHASLEFTCPAPELVARLERSAAALTSVVPSQGTE
jgi:probable F420-dependent oxidoreductase